MAILNQFLLRLAFGLSIGMALVSPRLVISGFFRNHLYVTLGISTLASLVSLSAGFPAWPALIAAAGSYCGSVCWLYEKQNAGLFFLWLVATFALIGILLTPWAGSSINSAGDPTTVATLGQDLNPLSAVTSGMVLGVTTAAMLLGHWYLNAPGMQLAPLYRLLSVAAVALGLHAILSGIQLAGHLLGPASTAGSDSVTWWMILILRWAFGMLAVAALLWMAWQTLRIPNTQSATGILYVAVIAVFTGELASLLLSGWSSFAL